MDAKPQRAFRALPVFSQANDENAFPTTLNATHQRNKSLGAPILKDAANIVKVPSKRTAFGDVSNVVRPLADSTAYGFKASKVSTKAATISASFASRKDNIIQAAAFNAPAQRPRTATVSVQPADLNLQSIRHEAPVTAPAVPTAVVYKSAVGDIEAMGDANIESAAPLQAGKTHAGAAKKTMFVSKSEFEQEYASIFKQPEIATIVDSFPEPARLTLKKSPRHYKSQPCLKNAEQKPLLRRTQSRLPVDRSAFKDVVFAGDVASDKVYANVSRDASEAPFVDAVENIHEHVLPSLPDEDLESLEILQQECEAVDVSVSVAPEELNVPQNDQGGLLPAPEEPTDFFSDVPAVLPAATTSEVGEAWDDDADFYDDQGYTTAHSFRSLGDSTTGGLTTVLMPKTTAKIQNELDIARAIVEASISPEDLDDEAWDISMVAEYSDDIYDYMKDLEARMLPSAHYMDMQTEIQWSMRAVLMEWLIQVHARFSLLPETLFLTVNYIDRFLSSKIVSVNKLQLVGATAIFIASKYEEIICPSIQEIVFMVDGGYTTEEILKAERFMLTMLGFELGWPGPMSFLRRISKADEYDLETRTLAKYFLEVTVMDERFVACPPSFLAAGAHCLARLMLYKGDWTVAHTHYSGYTWNQVRPVANVILHCCRDPRSHHAAVYEKYASSRFKKASIYVEEELRRGFSLPSHQALHHSQYRLSLSDSMTDSVGSGVPLEANGMDLLIHAES